MPATNGRSHTIRALARSDLPVVAQMFQNNFRSPDVLAPPSLESYLGELFLNHPWYEPDLASRVHVSADGKVNGFIGVLPLRMRFQGRPLRAAVAGSLMVQEPKKQPFTGAALLRSFLSGPQDLSLSETANRISQNMWLQLGGSASPLYSMEWVRLLHPASLGVSFLSEFWPAARLLNPLARATDRILRRMRSNPFRMPAEAPVGYSDADADDDTFIDCALRFASSFALHPDWDARFLRWLAPHMARKERHGALTRRVVYGNGPAPVGGYVYYGRPGGVAWVLQIFAETAHVDPVLDMLTAHALKQGCIAARGRTTPALMNPLLLRGCMFFHRSSTVIRARDPKLLAAIASGDAMITGLAAEGWTRLLGGTFE
jgi:hypothetical protein